MDLSVPTTKLVKASAIRVTFPFDEDDDIPEDFPGRDDSSDTITLTLDIDTKKVRDWPEASGGYDLYVKAVDQGTYALLDESGVEIAKLEDDSVPGCIPSEYGDYIDFNIAKDGTLLGWEPDADEIVEAFFKPEE
jgi:hypothetical protein